MLEQSDGHVCPSENMSSPLRVSSEGLPMASAAGEHKTC